MVKSSQIKPDDYHWGRGPPSTGPAFFKNGCPALLFRMVALRGAEVNKASSPKYSPEPREGSGVAGARPGGRAKSYRK